MFLIEFVDIFIFFVLRVLIKYVLLQHRVIVIEIEH